MHSNKLFVSVDMDEWYHARWATGSANSIWSVVDNAFEEVYGTEEPIGEIYKPTMKILELFEELDFKATFFFTGQVASFYPDLVRTISKCGHEIACHNYYHLDYEFESKSKFIFDLERSKNLLEDLSGQRVVGYRSPNSSIPQSIVNDLESLGFIYDSSVTPTRRLFNKFGKFSEAPRKPYHPSYNNIGKDGDSSLWEFPWAVFPGVNLPAGSGIMHRIAGDVYNYLATKTSLEKGHASYYFHPYEVSSSHYIRKINLPVHAKIFLVRQGKKYFRMLSKFLFIHRDILTNGKNLANIV